MSFVPCPNLTQIRERAAAMRESWPAVRLNHCELRVELEIPSAVKITDHMRRNPKHET
jgi:hypothetical protein